MNGNNYAEREEGYSKFSWGLLLEAKMNICENR